jgi:radical SAM protein with 4Fe4S-binding SPASM domain
MFLGEFMNPSTFSEFLSIFSGAYARWAGQIFSPFHLALILLMVGLLFAKRKKNKEAQEVLTLTLIYFLGAFAYFLLMGMQFIDHDYYYIDSFLPVLCLSLIWLVSNIQIKREWYSTAFIFAAISLIGFYSSARNTIELRYSEEYSSRSVYQYEVFKNANPVLNKTCSRCEYLPLCYGGCRLLAYHKNRDFCSINCEREYFKTISPALLKLEIENQINV